MPARMPAVFYRRWCRVFCVRKKALVLLPQRARRAQRGQARTNTREHALVFYRRGYKTLYAELLPPIIQHLGHDLFDADFGLPAGGCAQFAVVAL